MNITFRTDSSLQIGSGHVMRCLTLADELRQRGADIMFVCREHPGNMIPLIEAKGYPVVRLAQTEAEYAEAPEDLGHAAWLGVAWQQDAAETIIAVRDAHPQWLVIDHYALDYRWEQMLRHHVEKIMVIDDLADRPHDCDLLLDQNLYEGMETRYDNLVPKSCHKLLGPKYALLRPEFAVARKNLRERDGQVKRVLVFFGGVDPTNETEKTLQALTGISDRQFDVDVVVGGGNLHKEQINKICAANDGFYYHCQVDNMAELMAAADLAIGAGGATTWERCALGLPTLVIVVAENQSALTMFGAEKGLFFYLGEAASVSSNCIKDTINVFLYSPAALRCYSATSLRAVDARGVHRAAGILLPPQISVRKAQEVDCDSLYEWRNAEETRRFFFDTNIIHLDAHHAWFKKTLEEPSRILLIGEINGLPVGVLRYDISDEQAVISVYLVPGGQGAGVGTELIRCGSRWLKKHRPDINRVIAEIVRDNIASLRAFEQAGFIEQYLIYQDNLLACC